MYVDNQCLFPGLTGAHDSGGKQEWSGGWEGCRQGSGNESSKTL